jgi:hypothetical protein
MNVLVLDGAREPLWLRGSDRLAEVFLVSKTKPGSASNKQLSAKSAKDFAPVFAALNELLEP